MSETTQPHTILVHALLAGHTLLTRRCEEWIAQEILPGGRLTERSVPTRDPAAWAWRGAAR